MNLKLRRLVRTPSSEQYALYDLDAARVSGEPASIGKLDLHFTANGVYGTVLLWQDSASHLSNEQRRALISALLADLSQPVGLPDTFAVEFFCPDRSTYSLYHNLEDEHEAGA